jgi:hypothetical protein
MGTTQPVTDAPKAPDIVPKHRAQVSLTASTHISDTTQPCLPVV